MKKLGVVIAIITICMWVIIGPHKIWHWIDGKLHPEPNTIEIRCFGTNESLEPTKQLWILDGDKYRLLGDTETPEPNEPSFYLLLYGNGIQLGVK